MSQCVIMMNMSFWMMSREDGPSEILVGATCQMAQLMV